MLEAQSHPLARPLLDLEHPSAARVYDYLLGGSSNWSVDRDFVRELLRRFPEFQNIARTNRMFVNRVVKFLARQGVRQFLDIGSGVLRAGNTFQVADRTTPDCRVVYVDDEPVAVAHAEVFLDEEGDRDRHAVVQADFRDPGELWTEAAATKIFDLEEPIAVLLFAVLHETKPAADGDDVGARAVAGFRELLPVGSYLGVSHVTDDGIPADLEPKLMELKELCDTWCARKVYCRSKAAIEALLGDFKLVDPGMTWTPEWHPEEGDRVVTLPGPSHAVVWAGVGQKLS